MMKLFQSAVLLVTAICGVAAHADGPWGSPGFAAYADSLPQTSEALARKTVKGYWDILRSRTGIDPGRIRVVTFAAIDPVLARASQAGMGTLEFFTKNELADPGSEALLLDGPTLRHIGEKYDLSSVWMPSVRTRLPDGRTMAMDYLIVGQGKLIIGYPYESQVEVFADGEPREYLYEPFIQANIVNGPGQRGLFDIRALKSPSGKFQSFEGPMGASITAFQVDGSQVVVNYTLGVPLETRTGRTPIALKARPVAQFQ